MNPERERKVATLYIFSGLPGAGKTTLSRRFASHIRAAHLRIDTIEQSLSENCKIEIHDEGYRLAYKLAAENLRLGLDVVADSCNPINATREAWENVARESGALYVNIEIVCPDKGEHRKRIEFREAEMPGLKHLTWAEVEERAYDVWTRERVVIDTSHRTEAESFSELLSKLGQ